MASSNSASCSPSSSAVTIPVPGKSILKKPPVAPQSLFSRITRFLPNQQPQANDERPLKRAHFILPQIAVVYPISSLQPPSTATLKDEKRAIEEREAERRRRVVRGNSFSSAPSDDTDDWWSLDKVESFFRECCAGCDEQPDPGISAALKHASEGTPRTVDFSGVQFTLTSASILSDVLTIEWGLRKLIFKECDLDEHILKPILHALLIPGTLNFLSIASNRRLKAPAFRLIGAFTTQAKALQFLDLSQNNLDKKSVEYIVAALTTAPGLGLISLRMDDCNLRHAGLEVLARAVRTSSLRHISLRHNRINQSGAVALALMIRDYPDVVPGGTPIPTTAALNGAYPFSSPISSIPSSPSSSVSSLPLSSESAPSFAAGSVGAPPVPVDHVTNLAASALPPPPPRPILPPPRHPPTGPQTTYTPYVPRSRRGRPPPTQARGVTNPLTANPLSPTGQPIPIITSSPQGGVTTRHPVGPPGTGANAGNGPDSRHSQGPSAALLDKVRALDALPRLGALRTLDLKGNDLRNGVSYLAQVLKRNRTLKVLNLSENKLDVQGLVFIAEALKYNSSLETLDLSKNPCSGPGLEGIQSLRTAFTLNTALKRLFLSSTSLTSTGAIALAEFLPEATALLHLDLTNNNLDIASVMALRSGLKANTTMRCLDLNIPPGDEEFARMCRDILDYCVRNTEEAERNANAKDVAQQVVGDGAANGSPSTLSKASRKGVWGLIEDSELARSIRQGDAKAEGDVVLRARVCISQLQNVVATPPTLSKPSPLGDSSPRSPSSSDESPSEVVRKARSINEELSALIQSTGDLGRMEELLALNDELNALVSRVPATPNVRPALTLQGLGFKWNAGSDAARAPSIASPTNSAVSATLIGNGDAHVLHDSPVDEEEVTTPRIDKGKAKAEPEPEEPEKVLSPFLSFALAESESEDEDGRQYPEQGEDPESEEVASPTNRSRIWVEEEGEVFRKGAVLLGPEEMEGEYAGEELRRELLDAMVERPPPRPLIDEYGMEMTSSALVSDPPALEVSTTPLASPTVESKASPRPYISRRTSSSSIMSVLSPTLGLASPTANLDSASVGTATMSSPILRSPTILSPTLPSIAAARSYVPRSRSSSNTETA
ncbi:hypothetical protein HGRIS_014357 [Hohenbuehelia grisea]|uniref:RNI-like protein n=1 Tax=Hohenbuehelia grisea TaxID=104357 RepID=A0ABR3JVE3_9AGAR